MSAKAKLEPLPARDPKTGQVRYWDRENGAWMRDVAPAPTRISTETLQQAFGSAPVNSALPEVTLPATDPLRDLPVFSPDPGKTELRARHLAALAARERERSGYCVALAAARERLAIAEVEVLNGIRSEHAQASGEVAVADSELRRCDHDLANLGKAIGILDGELAAESETQRTERRKEIDRRLRALGVRMHTLLVAARDTRDLGNELKRLRHSVISAEQQRQLGAWEWCCVGIDRVLDQLEGAMRQDQIL